MGLGGGGAERAGGGRCLDRKGMSEGVYFLFTIFILWVLKYLFLTFLRGIAISHFGRIAIPPNNNDSQITR